MNNSINTTENKRIIMKNPLKIKTTSNKGILLEYTYKIYKRQKKYPLKDGYGINTFYQALFPYELKEYFDIRDNTIYLYKKNDIIYISGSVPDVEYKRIKISQVNQFSLPTQFFKVGSQQFTVLTVDFSKIDRYSNKRGLISLRLVD